MTGPLALAAVALLGCSAPTLPTDLRAAEDHERAGEYDRALAAYVRAAERCRAIHSASRRRAMCAAAHLGRAELLETMGRARDAAEAYAAAPVALERDPAPSATALYRAGRLLLTLDDDRRGYDLLWQALADYPDQAAAGDALRLVLRDGRKRDPAQLYRVLGELLGRLSGSGVGDNLLYALADLAEHERGDPRAARAYYDRIISDYPQSGLRDEAWWRGAALSVALRDPRGAVARLRALLATREVTLGPGSYFSIYLDNAQLELGRVLRDELGDTAGAAAAFRRLPRDYPASVLRDDALWELAVTWDRADDGERVCEALAALAKDWPDSKYELPDYAPALRARRGCPAPVQPPADKDGDGDNSDNGDSAGSAR